MNDKSKHGSFAGRGYYIALILCACAIGITGYVYNQNGKAREQTLLEQTGEPIPVATLELGEDVAVIATEPGTEPTVPQTRPSGEPERKKTLVTGSPLAGEEIHGYCMETLSYNQTTRDWRVHDGVDIAAAEGTPVAAAADGTVEAVYEDDILGHTVVVRHDGGYVTRYASLGEDVAVAAGETVTLGQTLGTVGSSALLETAMGSHLHFAVTCRDQPMDPAAFLALGSETE